MPKFVNFLHRVLVAVYRNKTNGRMNEHSCTRLMAMRVLVLNMAERHSHQLGFVLTLMLKVV